MIHINRIVPVVEASQVASARRAAMECAATLQLSEKSAGQAALIATELGTNLHKHGNGGSILFGGDDARPRVLIVISIDKGAGIPNVAAALRDGHSTSGSPGTGLGAISRASESLDIYTLPDKGTAICCTLSDEAPPAYPMPVPRKFPVAGVSLPKPGEESFGDAWAATATGDSLTVLVADGLGHGPLASTASSAAVRAFAERPDASLEELLQDLHAALRPTRGAAVGIARLVLGQRRVEFAGAGNIAGTIASDDGSTRKTVSLPGIVGHEMRKLQTFSYPWDASSVLILQSDGVSASWSMLAYPGLLQKEAALIAAVLYRDHCRGNDDATVVVAKNF